jgi:hypothetical protein
VLGLDATLLHLFRLCYADTDDAPTPRGPVEEVWQLTEDISKINANI